MKCPKCGTINGKTNKFCRECGLRLEKLFQEPDKPALEQDESGSQEEKLLGEALFEVWQLYESGDLDNALAKGEIIVRSHPNSASAHSILALILERKAELEISSGNKEAGEDLIKLAIRHYERIVDLNPNSVADREKLATLQEKISENYTPISVILARNTKRIVAQLVVAIKQIPQPYLIAVGVFFVVFTLALILISGGKDERPSSNMPSNVVEVPNIPQQTAQPSNNRGSGISVYSFEARTQPKMPSNIESGNVPAPAGEATKEVKPAALPTLDETGIKIITNSKKADQNERQQPKQIPSDKSNVKQPSLNSSRNKPQEDNTGGDDAASVLANAIRLYNEGKVKEAIEEARDAEEMFQAEIDAGRNVEAATRGRNNARRLAEAWEKE